MAECSQRFTSYDGPGLKEAGSQQAASPLENLPLPVSANCFVCLLMVSPGVGYGYVVAVILLVTLEENDKILIIFSTMKFQGFLGFGL